MAWTCSLLTYALLLLLTTVSSKPASQKAPRFKACSRNQPAAKLNECVRDSLQRAVPELVKGLPDYNLPTVDPLRVGTLEVPRGKTAVSVDISFRNLDLVGLRNSKIKSVNMNVQKYRGKAVIHIDGPIHLLGDYKVNGKVLVLPITGAGRCNVTLVRPRGEITELIAKPVIKDGKEYAQVTSLKFVVKEVDRVYYKMENLFNGNKELGENMNLVLNENWKQIFEDLRGPVQNALGQAFLNIANKVTQKVPYDVIFPLK